MCYLRTTVFVISAALSSVIHAQGPTFIGGRDFTLGRASLGGGTELVGAAPDTANGLTENTTWGDEGDGVSYRFSSPSEFRYDFVSPVTVDGNFFLYNGWDFQAQAIQNFSLSFFDSAGSLIGSPFEGVGRPGVNNELFTLPEVYADVKTASLRIDSAHTPHVEFREVAFGGLDCPVGFVFPVPLTGYLDPFPSLSNKPAGPLSFEWFLGPVDVQFLVREPTEVGAVCEAIGVGTRSLDIEVSLGNLSLATIRRSVTASVKVTQFQGGSPIADQAREEATVFTGADGGYINPHTPGHDVYRWSNPSGFDVDLGVKTYNTGPLEVWLDLENAGIAPGVPFDSVVNRAQQIVEHKNLKLVYQKHSIVPKTVLAIFDPGSTEMLVSDPTGQLVGKDTSGIIHTEAAGSAYFGALPLALFPEPRSGAYEVTLRGLESGDYELFVVLTNQTGAIFERGVSGFLAAGEVVTHHFLVPVPEPATVSLVLLCALLTAATVSRPSTQFNRMTLLGRRQPLEDHKFGNCVGL